MRMQYKRFLVVLVIVLTLASQSLTAFAATATVPEWTKDTDFWWSGWEHYSNETKNITLTYTNNYTLDHANSSTDYWWADNVQFRCTTVTYSWRVY